MTLDFTIVAAAASAATSFLFFRLIEKSLAPQVLRIEISKSDTSIKIWRAGAFFSIVFFVLFYVVFASIFFISAQRLLLGRWNYIGFGIITGFVFCHIYRLIRFYFLHTHWRQALRLIKKT